MREAMPGVKGSVDADLGQAPEAAVGAHDSEVVGEGEQGPGGEGVSQRRHTAIGDIPPQEHETNY